MDSRKGTSAKMTGKKQCVDVRSLAKMTIYVCGIVFPKYPSHTFPLFLLAEAVGRFKSLRTRLPFKKRYRLCPLPNRLSDALQKDNIIKSDHTIFVGSSIFGAFVPHPEVPWVNLTVLMESRRKMAAEGQQNGIVGKILNRQNSSMLVPIVELANCQAGVIFVPESTYSNHLTKYKLPQDHAFSVALGEFQVNHNVPQIATKATIALINVPFDMPNELVDTILGCYFEQPRFIYRNNTYEIPLEEELLRSSCFSRHHHTFSRLKKLPFRCVSLESKNNSYENHAIVVKNCTSLQQISSVNMLVPRQSLHEMAFANVCPDGLRRYFDALRASFEPFLSEKRASLLASRNIHPTFLLHGDRGSGKNTVITALASFLGIHLYAVDCAEIVCSISAQTETKLRLVLAHSNICHPLIICLQNFEVFGVDNEGNDDQRLIGALQSELMELFGKSDIQPLFVIASSNRRDIKSAVRRLFLEAIEMEPPGVEERYQILRWLHTVHSTWDYVSNAKDTRSVQVFNTRIGALHRETDETLRSVADETVGFLHGDLKTLYVNAKKSGRDAHHLTLQHFSQHLSAMQEQFSDSMGAPKVPKVLWSDIGGLARIKDEIQNSIGLPLRHVHLMGGNLRRSGILLYGPPGTGKTLVAKAVATECRLNFLAVQGPELLNMYVGQSEQNVREVFTRARSAAPCVLFLDELDSLAPNRGVAGDSGGVMDRVVSQLLAEMDGMGGESQQIFILAATNRPDLIDPALLRPGRFDKLFFVGPCITTDDKLAVLQAQTKKFVLDKAVKLKKIAEMLKSEMTGADIYSICSNAWLNAVRRTVAMATDGKSQLNELTGKSVIVCMEDFKIAVGKFVPSISRSDLDYFSNLRENFGS
ncbi:peroxisomal ATPase PEX6 [Phlebotomus argentipes]|uniref:peroxisomal ATPase PEX6 n=1 Tax=Phlebotomus argentipes TaxID=94469 RepID=UPI002892B486|nr:peroxisomal ATPase PEX6 [Phlebotomus argentipes]